MAGAMARARTIAEARAHVGRLRAAGKRVGFVPTMGALHEGHLELVRIARRQCDAVVVSIFVNPLQFGAGEDLDTYPRDLDRDAALLERERVDLLFAPDRAEIIGREMRTTVDAGPLAARLEGESRPGHFTGVATIVAKLFNIVGPCTAVFGQKDYQQYLVIERMVVDLDIPARLRMAPIVREPDGLAMSSRNVRLEPAQRAAAPVLHRALCTSAARVAAGETSAGPIAAMLAGIVRGEPLARLDYAELVHPDTLLPLESIGQEGALLLVAARFGAVRLIDNLLAGPGGGAPIRSSDPPGA